MKKWEFNGKLGILCKYRNVRNETNIKYILYDSNFYHGFVTYLKKYQNFLHLFAAKHPNTLVNNSFKNTSIYRMSNEIVCNEKNIINKFDNQKTIVCFNNLITSIRNIFIDSKTIYSRKVFNIIGQIDELLISIKSTSDIDFQTTYINDYIKISECSSFRRLQDKAQVFPLESNDYARTRLTHTIEVASVSRQIVEMLKPHNNEQKYFFDSLKSIVECGCLIHDIGNPPFGHYGEDVIRNYYKENWDILKIDNKRTIADVIYPDTQMYCDFIHFDGNAQSLRVMTKLQCYKHCTPIELSYSILGSIIKYPFDSTCCKSKSKFGYFYSENSVIEKMKEVGVFINGFRNPLCLLVEASDDISYLISDLDDSIKKKIITKEIFEKELKKEITKNANDNIFISFVKNYNYYISINEKNGIENSFEYTINYSLNRLKRDLIRKCAEIYSNNFLNIVYKGIEYIENSKNLELIEFDENEYYKIVNFLKNNLMKKYVYNNYSIISNEVKGGLILKSLLSTFTETMLSLSIPDAITDKLEILNNNKDKGKDCRILNLISNNYIDNFMYEYRNSKNEKERIYYKLKLVVDFISGMTDTYALEVYQIINGIK